MNTQANYGVNFNSTTGKITSYMDYTYDYESWSADRATDSGGYYVNECNEDTRMKIYDEYLPAARKFMKKVFGETGITTDEFDCMDEGNISSMGSTIIIEYVFKDNVAV